MHKMEDSDGKEAVSKITAKDLEREDINNTSCLCKTDRKINCR